MAALTLVERGYRVLALAPAGKRPHRTLAPRGVKSASADPATVRAWWGRCPDANVGVACTDGAVVLDVDGREGIEALKQLRLDLGGVPTVRSGSGDGLHLYFGGESPTGHCADAGKHLDLRGTGAYVVAPPSRHESGGRYAWVTPGAPLPVRDLPPLPEALQPTAGADGASELPPVVPEPMTGEALARLLRFDPEGRALLAGRHGASGDPSRADWNLAWRLHHVHGLAAPEVAGALWTFRPDMDAKVRRSRRYVELTLRAVGALS